MANYPGLFQRGSIWYVRKRVPKDVADGFQADQIKHSLKTNSLKEAKTQYHMKMLEIEASFEKVRIASPI